MLSKTLCPFSFLKRKHYCRFLGNIEKVYPLMYMKWRKRMTCSFPPFLWKMQESCVSLYLEEKGVRTLTAPHTLPTHL